jgi:CBS domain containing-hemolysin-like protein
MLRIHVEHNALEKEEGDIVMGALSYKDKSVEHVMTPIEDVTMLCVSDHLNFQV